MSRSVPLSALQVFMEVCKQGSMKLAADRLSVTPGAISQQVKGLEERMGMPLFRRAHRRLELTPPGERLKAQLAASFAAIETVWGDYECSRRRATRLSINTTAALASAWLIPRLGHFLARWPTIDVDVSSSPDEPDLRRTGIDVAIRERPSNYPGHQSQALWTLATLAIAAPELLRGARRIETPADCMAFPLLQDASRSLWQQWLKGYGLEDSRSRHGSSFADDHLLISAVIAGRGLALVSELHARPFVDAGRVVVVLAAPVRRTHRYYLISAQAETDSWKIRTFGNWLASETAAGSADALQ